MTAALMVHPALLAEDSLRVRLRQRRGGQETVAGLLESFGHTDVIDLGDITTARGTEMMLPMWLRLMGALGTPMFNFKIVR